MKPLLEAAKSAMVKLMVDEYEKLARETITLVEEQNLRDVVNGPDGRYKKIREIMKDRGFL